MRTVQAEDCQGRVRGKGACPSEAGLLQHLHVHFLFEILMQK
jgi:hypothetical protein